MKKITINEEVFLITDESKLTEIFSKIEDLQDVEIWLENEEKKLCILLNERRAFFMFLEDTEGTSYIVFDKEVPENLTEDFMLGNGQLDEYPKKSTNQRSMAKEIAKYFFDSGERFQNLTWIKC